MTASVSAAEKQLGLVIMELRALGTAFQRCETKLQALTDKVDLAGSAREVTREGADEDSQTNLPEVSSAATKGDLPELPNGVTALHIINEELDDILKDPELGLPEVSLSRIQRTKAQSQLAAARARIAEVEGELQVSLLEAMDKLRTDGSFIEYNKGEKYQVSPGVMSVAENTPDGRLRMFYIHREGFPEVYDKKQAKESVAEECARRLVSMLRSSNP